MQGALPRCRAVPNQGHRRLGRRPVGQHDHETRPDGREGHLARLPHRRDPARDRRDAADREHHPALDLRAAARDRGDEARRCDELVHPGAVRAGRARLRGRRLGLRRDPAPAREGNRAAGGHRAPRRQQLGHSLNALHPERALDHHRRSAPRGGGLRPDSAPLPAGLVARGRQKRPSRSERHRRRHAPARRPVSELTVRLPERRVEPETVIAHLGPTNSGKTHDALRFLVETGKGVYAAPLRMLAQEAHRRLEAELGEERVGLVTGEERVNPGAPIICCTAEMAPMHGETLVLDEVQWAEDEERGSAWTRLLLGGEYRHILLLGAVEALPLVRHAFPQAEIRFFERKAPLDWTGRRAITGLRPGTVVVAFSRRAVIGLAGELNQLHPGAVACLYGAMPLASRREEIDRFIAGRAEVCAATDVLGHGVNLPCETLLFAETTKFDGKERRDLEPWEIAQIAGRAGRFGFHERGHVGVLTGVPWADPDPELVRAALAPHVPIENGHLGYRVVDSGRLRPQLSDLNVTRVDELEPALHAWRQAALRYWSVDGWLEVESIQPVLARLDAVRDALHHARRTLELADVWKLVQAPVDEDGGPLLGTLAAAVAGDKPQQTVVSWILDPRRLDSAGLEEAEQAAREASILRWFALQYPGVAGVTIERAAELEEAAAARVVRELLAEIEDPTIGRCRVWGARTAPGATLCDRCFMARGYRAGRREAPRSISCVARKSAIVRPSGSDTVESQSCVA